MTHDLGLGHRPVIGGVPRRQQVVEHRIELLLRRIPRLEEVVVQIDHVDGVDGGTGVGVGRQQHTPGRRDRGPWPARGTRSRSSAACGSPPAAAPPGRRGASSPGAPRAPARPTRPGRSGSPCRSAAAGPGRPIATPRDRRRRSGSRSAPRRPGVAFGIDHGHRAGLGADGEDSFGLPEEKEGQRGSWR